MKIAVIGAGAIGSLVAGYLKQRGKDVILIGHQASVEAIRKQGLKISGVRGTLQANIEVLEKLNRKTDLIILAVKTQDIEEAVNNNLEFLKDTTILTVQNGVQADSIVSRFLPKDNIVSSIVMFGSTYLSPNEILHNFEGKWIIGRIFSSNDDNVTQISKVLNEIFPVVITDNILGMKYLKIFVNANNCLAAILGKSMQETFKNLNTCRISISIWKEGLKIMDKAKIRLESLPDFPVERLRGLISLPVEEAAKIFSGIMTNLSKEPLFGSILQSIQRGRVSEIDYINGEFVNLARSIDERAPLNEKLVRMVHNVERTKKFFSEEELRNETQDEIS